MLFNSFAFLAFYLPITVVGFFLVARWRHLWAAGWLTLASLVFYGWWDYHYLPLLLGSILFNFYVAKGIGSARDRQQPGLGRLLLWLGVGGDLGLLAYFKYFNFFVDNIVALTGMDYSPARIILPIGISFFTFTQIAFLVDTHRDLVREYKLVHYGLFVTYFPHLVAGPVLHHREMMPQFQDTAPYSPRSANFAVGLTIFAFGLFKKVVLADNFAVMARPVFDAPAGEPLDFFGCWTAALAYTLQIYFDFSGYSDMAIGLSRLFGIQLPLNFNSPYKAENIAEFWRRWHMTLSRFLREYLYVPLGGNRKGEPRRYVNLLATMLLGGLWHGAGWTYVIWGGLHGFYLVIHRLWQRARPGPAGMRGRIAGTLLTFMAVVVAWVFFRAPTAGHAFAMLQAMSGAEGLLLPDAWQARFAPWIPAGGLPGLRFGVVPALEDGLAILAIAAGLAWVWLAPNVQEVMLRFAPALDAPPAGAPKRWQWRPTAGWALVGSAALVLALVNLTQVSDFIYFQF